MSRVAPVCLLMMLLPATSTSRQGNGNNPATTLHPPVTPKKRNNRYDIAYPRTTRSWSTTSGRVTSNTIAEAVVRNLVQRLAQEGFVRVQPLDVQCCNVTVEVLDATSRQGQLSLDVRIGVQDVDKQFIYANKYRGEAPAGPDQVGNAAAAVGKAAISDNGLSKALTHD